jgi:ATP-dependent RNA helicase DeaD
LIENMINKVIPAMRVTGFEVARASSGTPAARELFNTAVTRSHDLAVR